MSSALDNNTILIIPNDEMKKNNWISEKIQNEAKRQRGGFLSMLLGIIGASLLGDTLTGKGINRAYENKDYENKMDF